MSTGKFSPEQFVAAAIRARDNMPPAIASAVRRIDDLIAENQTLREEIDGLLDTEVGEVVAMNQELFAENQRLRAENERLRSAR